MNQEQLFYDGPDDALATTVMALGGYKKVAGQLWSGMKIESAYARLKSCFNPDKPEKLSPDEVDRLVEWGRAVGCHAYMHYMGQRHRYEVTPMEPEDERDKLMRQFIQSVEDAKQFGKLLEKMNLNK